MMEINFTELALQYVDDRHYCLLNNNRHSKLESDERRHLLKPLNDAGNKVGLKYTHIRDIVFSEATVEEILITIGVWSCR